MRYPVKLTKAKEGGYVVTFPAKILLLNERVNQKVRPAELARRLQRTPQEIRADD